MAAGIGATASTDETTLDTVLGMAVGWSFVLSGLVGAARRPENRVGAVMAAIGVLWFAGALLRESTADVLFTLGIWLSDAWLVLFVLLLVAFPYGRFVSNLDRLLVLATFVGRRPAGGGVAGRLRVPLRRRLPGQRAADLGRRRRGGRHRLGPARDPRRRAGAAVVRARPPLGARERPAAAGARARC